jgi:hypothetical protein
MSGKMKNGLELSKQSWGALRQNRQLLVFPIISMVIMTIVLILFLIPTTGLVQSILDTGEVTQAHVWPGIGLLFLYYLIASIVVIFSNAALTGANKRLIEGKSATIGDGLRIASSHLGTIVKYALISATVGVLVRLIIRFGDKSDNIVVAILSLVVGGAIAAAWSLAIFFAIPVMVFEDLNVRDSLKRSVDIFKQTWGEGFTGDVVIGGLSCLVYLAIFLVGGGLVAVGVLNAMSALIIFGLLVVVLGTTVIDLLYGAVNGIFQTSLYHYALTGDAGPFIDIEMANAAFKS